MLPQAGTSARRGSPLAPRDTELSATLACLGGRGATLAITIANHGAGTLVLGELHIGFQFGPPARERPGFAVDMLLAPDASTILPGERQVVDLRLSDDVLPPDPRMTFADEVHVSVRAWRADGLPAVERVFAFSGCAGNAEEPGIGLEGGVLATFDVYGEQFRVWVTNPATIEQILALANGQGTATIPVGRVRYGPGQAAHNRPWNWHLDPWDIEMAESTIELCDGTPSYVDAHLDEWIATVGIYCPWGAVLVDVEDFRQVTDA
jgi:hypothetical protein